MTQDIFTKYRLPHSVKVLYKKNSKGIIFAKLPEYPGCMTLANNEIELIKNVTDAILTYFEVPREIAQKSKILYIPTYLEKLLELHKESITPKKTLPKEEKSASFLLYGLQRSYGKYSNIR